MNKNTPMKLTRDCTCPVCGFKTMALKCRQCGQRLKGEEKGVPIQFTYAVVENERIVFAGDIHQVCKFVGYSSPSAVCTASKRNTLVKGRYKIKRRRVNDQ